MLLETTLRTAEAVLNRGIGQSTTAAMICAKLEGRSLLVCLQRPSISFSIQAAAGRVRVLGGTTDSADASISGPAVSMRRMLGADPEATLGNGEIQISGDTEIAEQFGALLRMARPDLEEELSHLVGDAAAHQLANAARDFQHWIAGASQSISRSMSEYVQEERRDVPTRTELGEFLDAVDTLANDLARIEARVARLRRSG
jgi:ubiquinone biosynthesis protein UbiJ